MAKQHLLAAVLTAYILLAGAAAAATITSPSTSTTAGDEAETTVYDVLHQNNLPRGLLPQGVQSYEVHVGGALDVTLPGECSFSVAADGNEYRFRYGRRVGGVLVNQSIARAYGIRMELGSTWFDVGEMRAIGNRLKVQLPASTQWFPIIAFAQSPRCN